MAGKAPAPLSIQYTASRTAQQFHQSTAFVRGLMGPVGGGKSVACCFEIFTKACQQRVNQQGQRKSRWAIVRNTSPELRTTTMRTWLDWFPEESFGSVVGRSPIIQELKVPLPDGSMVVLEILFLALDKAEDAKKLLSLELTGVWFNEAREIPLEILEAAQARVGRYPSSKDGGCSWYGVIMDTNPPDDTHWWYLFSEKERPENHAYFAQPSGLDVAAENLENLLQPEGYDRLSLEERRACGRQYYTNLVPGKSQEWVNVYIHGRYGFIQKGMPVYKQVWRTAWHVSEVEIPVNPKGGIYLGIDSSGRRPAAVIAQRSGFGQIQLLDELVSEQEGQSAKSFARQLRELLNAAYPVCLLLGVTGDPAGGFKGIDDDTFFDILEAVAGLKVKESPVQAVSKRLEIVADYLRETIESSKGPQPALLISPKCKMVIRGFEGGYIFKEVSTAGVNLYDNQPVKNQYADPHDALQYLLAGMGGYEKLLERQNKTRFIKRIAIRAGL